MIYVVNYADVKFADNRKYCSYTAIATGRADKVFEYSPDDIPVSYKNAHKEIFSYERGNGLWLWKPYIISHALNRIKDGDYLMYIDSGAFFVDKIQKLIDVMNECHQDLLTFELPLLQRQFTKKETFDIMGITQYDTNQRLSGYILFKKTSFTLSFVKEWLFYMENESALSFKHFDSSIEEFPDFYSHREDQSILTLLCLKYALPSFRDPSQFGDRPWMYASSSYSYNPKEYKESTYPKIVVSNRKENPKKYRIKELIQTIGNKLGLYTQKYYFWKFNIHPLKSQF